MEQIKTITGKRPTTRQYKYHGDTFFVGKPLTDKDTLAYSNDYKLADYQVNLGEISGSVPVTAMNSGDWKDSATSYLVTNNYIRQAKVLDIKGWEDKVRETYKRTMGDAAYQMEVPSDMHVGLTYVVQKTFTIPNDFCYGHFINFIIPNGVSAPENRQNCGFYFLKDGSEL